MMSNKELLVKMKNAANNSIVNKRGLELYYMGKLQAFILITIGKLSYAPF